MPVIAEQLTKRAVAALDRWGSALSLAERQLDGAAHSLIARVDIPFNSSSPAGLIQAGTVDPWRKSGKYALAWVYFCVIVLITTSLLHFYHAFSDRIRTAMHEEELQKAYYTSSPATDYEMPALQTDKSTQHFFPRTGELPQASNTEVGYSTLRRPINLVIALFRWVFYRPVCEVRYKKGWQPLGFPPVSVIALLFLALCLVCLYTFVPRPLYWQSIQFGSPPVAIRSGMLAVALMPWIVAMSMKANLVTLVTGIGHERLNVLHRWLAYLCLFLSLVHTVPFYVQPLWNGAQNVKQFSSFFNNSHFYVYGTGVAALVPLCALCVQSLPIIRRRAYELFVTFHVPLAIVYLAMLFWHCNNFLTSWSYLWATAAIWFTSYIARIFFLNWSRPWRLSWLIGEEAVITILPENAVKVTVPTQMRWRPGQYVYLRMPGISWFENHPFTVASLCSDDFPSDYGEEYRDMILIFRPFGGFTKRLMEKGLAKGPWHTYRAFLDGPYGGMKRRMESFDNVVLVAGGSGITAIVSQILDLVKRMRDGKAITKNVHVIWALKRPETMEWFREELRICREFAPPDSVKCQFYITAAKRREPKVHRMTAQTTQKHINAYFHDRINDAFQGVAEKRASWHSKRNSALIREEAEGNTELERELRTENEDTISPLPQAHLVPGNLGQTQSHSRNFSYPNPQSHVEKGRNLSNDIAMAVQAGNTGALDPSVVASTFLDPEKGRHVAYHPDADAAEDSFNFGFPSTPTEFQKNLMRFAFLPAAARGSDGWSTEYGRPDLPYTLRQVSQSWGRRTCVFVCGPPSMRIAVAQTVAELQADVVRGKNGMEEVFLHTENYAI